ncbi:hypothetical protein [Arcanobacterium hippocoleae]|uniref:hypothetical protein n=1 Tax=Arcanobacterium hippocoleae TaxID=149017 RepID=UPI00333E4F4F
MLSAIVAIVPQIVLRPTAGIEASFAVFLPGFLGFFIFTVSIAVIHQLNLVVPRKPSRKIVSEYLGHSLGVATGAAQILAYAILVVLGVEIIIGALRFIFPIGASKSLLTALLVVIFALPTLFRCPKWAPAAIIWIARLAAFCFVFVISVALVSEALEIGVFRSQVTDFPDTSSELSYSLAAQVESFLAACLPAGTIILLGERILVAPENCRVRLKRSIRFFFPVLLLIALTLYISVILFHPYQLDVMPIVAISMLVLPRGVTYFVLGILVCLGSALTLSSYWQLPRILREMALEGLLPNKLGVQDSVNARRFIVLAIAILGGCSTFFISTAQSLAMIFILAAYLIALFTCLAMISRSQAILRTSLVGDERQDAKKLRWIFGGYSLVLLSISASFLIISVKWVFWTLILLAGPVLVLGFYSFGRGRVNRALNVEDFLANREIPTKVHGVILLSQLNEAALKAVDWAKAMRFASTQAICVDIDSVRTKQLRNDWIDAEIPLSLTILGTPAGALRGPVIEFIQSFRALHPHEPVTVILPRVMGMNAISQLFGKLYTPGIVSQLRREPGVMILEVPYLVDTISQD